MNNLILKVYCSCIAARYRYANVILFVVGVILITTSLTDIAAASSAETIIKKQLCKILALLEGAFGALITVVAGLAAVVTAAMGAYKMAMSCVVIACGSYLVQAFMKLFFGESSYSQCVPDAQGRTKWVDGP